MEEDKRELEKQVEQYESDLKSGKKKSKKTVIKYILNISLVLIITALSIFLTLYKNTGKIIENLVKCDYRWLLVIVGIMTGAMLIRSFVLFCFARLYTRNYHFHQAIANDQIGVFYNAVTPGASGGQIMQAYTYKKQGLHISSAVSALAMYSIVFQGVLIIYGLLAFIIKFDLIMSIDNVTIAFGSWFKIEIPALVLTILGFLLNIFVILIVLLMSYWHGFHNFIMGPCISFLHKIHLIKDPDKKRESLRIQVENFKIEFRRLLTNIPFTILVSISFIAYMTIKYSIPYFCGLALGNQSTVASFWDSVFLGNYHQMVTGLIPIPGAAGVSEFFFDALFYNSKDPSKGFYYVEVINNLGEIDIDATKEASKSLSNAALLIWRTITFVFPILAAGFVTAFYHASPKEEVEERGEIPNRGTFVALQKETYIMRKEEVDALVHTTQLNREALLNKLKPKKSDKEKNKNKKSVDNNPPEIIKSDKYDEIKVSDEDN